jgi:hypothetical protein
MASRGMLLQKVRSTWPLQALRLLVLLQPDRKLWEQLCGKLLSREVGPALHEGIIDVVKIDVPARMCCVSGGNSVQ